MSVCLCDVRTDPLYSRPNVSIDGTSGVRNRLPYEVRFVPGRKFPARAALPGRAERAAERRGAPPEAGTQGRLKRAINEPVILALSLFSHRNSTLFGTASHFGLARSSHSAELVRVVLPMWWYAPWLLR